MRPRLPPLLWPFLGLAAVLLGLAAGVGAGQPSRRAPAGDGATHPLIALSLAQDRDLVWDQRDLDRAYRTWNRGPDGLVLAEGRDRTLHYARPIAYPLAALPFLLVLGPSGPAVLNTLLLLAMLGATLWLHRGPPGAEGNRTGAGPLAVFVGGSFLLSYTLAHAWRSTPTLFEAAGVFLPVALALALRRGPAVLPRTELAAGLAAGLLLGAAVTSAPPLALIGIVPLAEIAALRRWRALAGLVLGAVVAVGLLAAAEHRLAGRWSAWQPGIDQLTFRDVFPGQLGADARAAEEPPPRPAPVRSAGRLARESWWLLAGRHGGVLPYFPFTLLAVALGLAGRLDRPRALLLAAALALVLWVVLAPPVSLTAGSRFAGHRWLAVLAPVLALLPSPRVFGRGESAGAGRGVSGRLAASAVAAAVLAAAIWTVPALAAALAAGLPPAAPTGEVADGGSGAHLGLASFSALPVEPTLLARLDGYGAGSFGDGLWLAPASELFLGEGHRHGAWLRGGARADLLLVASEPRESVSFTVFSPLPDNVFTADGGGERVVVRFDSPGKRAGVRVTVPVEPLAGGLGLLPDRRGGIVYRVRVTTTGGWVPAAADPASRDRRYLSTFLSFTGGPP